MRYRSLLTMLLLVCLGATAADERSADFTDRERYASELLTLPLAEGQMTVLQRASRVPSTHGNALLFADIGSDPERSADIAALRRSLNDRGWNTWAVFPPATPAAPAAIPSLERPTSAPEPEAGDRMQEWLPAAETTTAISALRDALAAQLARVREELPKGSTQILIAEGMSATLLAEVLATEGTQRVDALIVLGPYLPTTALNRAVGETLAGLDLPLLDLVQPDDHQLALDTLDDRRVAASLHFLPHYRQRRLAITAFGNPQPLETEVNAFLRYLGW